jgi:hypothetical protein
MSKNFIDELEIWDFSGKENKREINDKKESGKKILLQKRTTSLFRDVLTTLNITGQTIRFILIMC